MGTMTRGGAWAVIAALGLGGFLPVPAAPVPSEQGCPAGQHEDSQTPGFQCVPGWCPPGMLLDTASSTCVAAPGVPPPALPQS